MYLLDTNVLSEIRRASVGRGDSVVLAWAKQIDLASTFISAMSVYELEIGIRAKERHDPSQAAILRRWLEVRLASEFAGRIIPVDHKVALRAAALNVPDRRPFVDGSIAATAWIHNLVVVTRNVRDFAQTGVEILNPWD